MKIAFVCAAFLFLSNLSVADETKTAALPVLAARLAAAEATGSAFDISDETQFVRNEQRADELTVLQQADGSWVAIDYGEASRNVWLPAVRHLRERVLFLGQMYRATGRAPYAAAAKKGLDCWLAKRLQNPNWWWNEIGAPQAFGVAAILIRDTLTAEDRARYADYLEVSQIKMAGQNRVWLSRIVLMRGLLRGDAALVDKAAAAIASEVCVSDGPEGIAADWSFRQHGPQMQFGNYGASFFINLARLANVFATTPWAFSEEKLDILQNLGEKGFRWTLWNGNMDFSALGRQIVFDAQRKKAQLIARALAEFEGSGRRFPSDPPTGLRFFPQSAYAVYRPGAWMASVKMHTHDVLETETWINGENTLGGHLADGSLFLYATGREYENIAPLWKNWRLIPGVTSYLDLPPVTRPYNEGPGANEVNEMSATADRVDFKLQRDGLSVRKSWCFSPTGVACKGTVAATNAASRVVTCVEHALAAENARICGYDPELGCLHVENGCFVYEIFAPEAAIHATIEERTGDWEGISPPSVGKTVSGRVLLIYIDHGIQPELATYDYTVSFRMRK